MSQFHSPRIITDGLVLMLDAANGESFRGGPATNLLPNAAANGRFTTSNGWGTYNTNQYNSNQYFSIGTISSVTDNIVTTSSNHPLRTFDVVRPQTTGGGVTAGVDYFVKKISNTTFSLHQYNSSQNGSQGYINPSTGFHKVHDSIALDQRVSINSTSFPTMWWGAPHLPNSGIVKEVVEGGGYVPGTNSMRIHVTRNVSATEGMAYNVVTPVTQGDIVTVSYWMRTNAFGVANNVAISYQAYFGPTGGWVYPSNPVLTENWQLVTHQFTAPVTYSFVQYFFPPVKSAPYWVEIADLMVEVGPAPSTTRYFTTGTRGTTVATGGGWANLVGTSNNGELVNSPTFNSGNGGSLVFDGVDDVVTVPSTNLNNCDYSVEAWFNCNTINRINGIIGDLQFDWWTIMVQSNNTIRCKHKESDSLGGPAIAGSTQIQTNTWYHVVMTFNTVSGMKLYVNGSLDGSTSNNQPFTITNRGPQFIGQHRAGVSTSPNVMDGRISGVKIYKFKTLTATEVLQNYNATKGRYGL